jgi:hypothetical protein
MAPLPRSPRENRGASARPTWSFSRSVSHTVRPDDGPVESRAVGGPSRRQRMRRIPVNMRHYHRVAISCRQQNPLMQRMRKDLYQLLMGLELFRASRGVAWHTRRHANRLVRARYPSEYRHNAPPGRRSGLRVHLISRWVSGQRPRLFGPEWTTSPGRTDPAPVMVGFRALAPGAAFAAGVVHDQTTVSISITATGDMLLFGRIGRRAGSA